MSEAFRPLERMPEQNAAPPAVESLLHPTTTSAWPREVLENSSLQEAARERTELIDSLDTIYRAIPSAETELSAGLAEGKVLPQDVARAHHALAALLEKDPYAARLAYYTPFELLPDEVTLHHASPEVAAAAQRLETIYMERWRGLLAVQDVRANFVDGDVMEVELRDGDLPRVVKAAHLSPKLVERGMLSVDELLNIVEGTEDETLRGSMADALSVVYDMRLLRDEHKVRMSGSDDPLLRNMLTILSHDAEHTLPQGQDTLDTSTLIEKIRNEMQAIESHKWEGATAGREKWLRGEEKKSLIREHGDVLARALRSGEVGAPFVHGLATSEPEARETLILGLRSAMEMAAKESPEQAKALFSAHKDTLEHLWQEGSPDIKDQLTSLYCRVSSEGVIDSSYLKEIGVLVPELAGPFSKNVEKMGPHMKEIREMTKQLSENPELSELVYPVSLAFGSKLKGYGYESADTDLAVFVRPGVQIESRQKLQELVRGAFAHERVGGKALEFWLEEDGESLRVRDFAYTDVLLGESSFAHILFEAAWCGDRKAIEQLHAKLLAPYLLEDHTLANGKDARAVWLEEMERDLLQYRLMHKGYERFFPPKGGIQTRHADDIDGGSAFWDSGYRRTATKLFASNVFLPRLTK